MTLKEAVHLLPALPAQSSIVIVCPNKSVHVRYTNNFGYTITTSVLYEGNMTYKECECGELLLPPEAHLHTWSRMEVEDVVRRWVKEDEVSSAVLVVPFPYYETELPISL
jgi:hypothetical protein